MAARRGDPMTFPDFGRALVLLLALAVACAMPAQSDTFWQLRAGQQIWRTGHVPHVDTWSFTQPGRAWPDHEWLWQAIAYALHHVGGMPLLAAVNAVVAVAAVYVVRRLAPPQGRLGILLLILALAPLSTAWSIRPQVASLLLLAVTLSWLAHEHFLRLPLLFLLWANLHAGVSTGGLLVVAVTVLAVVDHLRRRTPQTRARMLHLLLVAPACAVATLLTPLGWGLWTYVLGARDDPAHRFISEWFSVLHLSTLAVIFWLWLAAVVLAVVLRRERFQAWPERVLALAALVVAPIAMSAVRNVAMFVLLALPVVLVAVAPAAPRPHDDVRWARPALAVVGVIGLAAVVLVGIASPASLRWQPMSPAAATAVERCPAPVYNEYAGGGYLLFAVPANKVFVDSRQDNYSYPFLRKAFLTELAPARHYRSVFRHYGIRCAAVLPGSAMDRQLRHDHWRPAYVDSRWAVLLPPAGGTA